MSLDGSRYDAVVVGGGFAGVIAARDLTEQGNRVLLLEARDRLGGRTWTKTFPGTDVDIELGGQFIVPELNPDIVRELERYGVPTADLPWPESMPVILNGTRFPGPFPVPIEQIPYLEAAVLHCVQAAARIDVDAPFDHQNLADLDIPTDEFFAALDLPPETYDFVTTVFGLYTLRFPEESSVLLPLHFLAHFQLSAYSMWGILNTHIRTASLYERIAADVTEVRLECPVVRVDQTGEDVVVTTAGGETVSASAVVIATPVNIWNDIEFLPQLCETKRVTSAERHGCDRSAKALIRVRNAPNKPAIFAAPRSSAGAVALFSEHEFANGDQLMGIFGLKSVEGDDYHLDFNERESIARALEALLPGAELIEFDTHDYVTDPFSKGDQISWRPGRLSRSHSVLGSPEGRLAFATADISQAMATIEGAIRSGHKAARQTMNHLVREREAAIVGGR